ncbi:MAG: hypothetical protein EZS28_008110 [Streblomastix strix]|uniref:Uncharacterized protein n=1 Tax=Streblomastix strix TaxID=222440 RepID=A0A5J4WN12_9EUKA|nr:MAG: hypothetical protein EZS28_008110 [Streblomastix strix]
MEEVNFNVDDDLATVHENMTLDKQKYYGKTDDGSEHSELLKFRVDFSPACGPFNQLIILRDAQNLWNAAIYARDVSQLESIIAGKRHCGVFIDNPLCDIDNAAAEDTPFFYQILYDITFSDDFIQDLKIVWLIKLNVTGNNHLANAMITPEKSDFVCQLSGEKDENPLAYSLYNVKLVNLQNVPNDAKLLQISIIQITDAKFEELEIQNA